MRRALCLAPVIALFGAVTAFGQNLLLNPGFANPPATSCTFNQGAPADWQSSATLGLNRNASIWTPTCPSAGLGGDSDGSHAAFSTGGTGNGQGNQTVTIPSANGSTTYRFSGLFAGGGPSGSQAVFKLVAGSNPNANAVPGAILTVNAIPGDWTPFSVQLTPTAGTTQLTAVFRLNNPNGSCCIPVALQVDAVKLEAVTGCPNLPTLTSVNPVRVIRGTNNFALTISGANFSAGNGTPVVTLVPPSGLGGSDVVASNVVVNNATTVTATFNIPNTAPPGPDWRLRYEQPQCSTATLDRALLVYLPMFTNGSFESPSVGACTPSDTDPADWRKVEPGFGEWGFSNALNLNGFFDGGALSFVPTCPLDGSQFGNMATDRGANFARAAAWQTFAVTPGATYTLSGLFAGSGDLETFIDLLDGEPDENFTANPANLLSRQTVQNGQAQFDWRFVFTPPAIPTQNHMTVVWRSRSLGADQTIASHAEALAIEQCLTQPTVSGIVPDRGVNSGVVNITNLSGSNFTGTPTIILTREGASRTATNVTVVNAGQITCQIDLTGLTSGRYDLVVKQGGCIATQANAFLVVGANFVNGGFEDPTAPIDLGTCTIDDVPVTILGTPAGWNTDAPDGMNRDGNAPLPPSSAGACVPSTDGGHYASMSSGAPVVLRAWQTVQVSPSTPYKFSGEFAGTGTFTLRLLEGEITGNELNSSTVTLTPGQWAAGEVTGQTQGGNVMTVVWEISNPGPGGHADGLEFVVDGVACNQPWADADADGDVDQDDFGFMQLCITGPSGTIPDTGALELCRCFDADFDTKIEQDDVTKFENCATGPEIPVAGPNCPN